MLKTEDDGAPGPEKTSEEEGGHENTVGTEKSSKVHLPMVRLRRSCSSKDACHSHCSYPANNKVSESTIAV